MAVHAVYQNWTEKLTGGCHIILGNEQPQCLFRAADTDPQESNATRPVFVAVFAENRDKAMLGLWVTFIT